MNTSNPSYLSTEFDLSGKVALISGGAGLLGKVFCTALYEAGASIIIADKNEKSLRNIKDELQSGNKNPDILTCQLDITNTSSIEKCITDSVNQFDGIDILVNSAAIDPKFDQHSDVSEYMGFSDFSLALWNESINVNLTGCFLLTKYVCKIMEKKNEGSIINLGSNYGLVGPDQRIYRKKGQAHQQYKPVVYSVCKAGIIGFTKYLAAYYSNTKIRANVLTPSGVYNAQDAEFVENYSSKTILGRMSDRNEYKGAIIFLASDASSYMTGSNLVIDGGWTSM
jgi:NAD(P)-dependent dehydrogenase (short-subunit alcohol dehydrogenase family)